MATTITSEREALEVRRTFNATPQRVFDAWTQPEALKRWCAPGPLSTPRAEVDLRVGGRYRLLMRGPDGTEHMMVGTYQEVDPPRRLVYTWSKEGDPEIQDSVVMVDFHDRGGSTEVVLRHAGLQGARRDGHEAGWNRCFDQLDGVVATAPAPRSATRQFAEVYAKEHATTLRVLAAFPAGQASYTPHARSSTALQLAWTFVRENNVALAALQGPLSFEGGFPPPPPSMSDVIAEYAKSAKALMTALEQTPEARLKDTVTFFTGPKQMGDVPVGEVLWFLLMDSVHHRGQLSVYLRCAGGKVPSIYGPSADEAWT